MLIPEDIRARINRSSLVSPSSLERHRDESQTEIDDVAQYVFFVFPLLLSVPHSSPFLFSSDATDPGDDDFMFSTPAAPTPSRHKPMASSSASLASPVMSSMPMRPMLASLISPDDMLRA